jgi:putative glutamine amidotransferase
MYLDLVRHAGGMPLVLPAHGTFESELLDRLDGIVLTGGGDVDPVAYRRERSPLTEGLDVRRDVFELELAREAVARDVPLLAICRGVQVLNVALDGTLLQDIASEMPGAVEHRDLEHWDREVHAVELEPASVLESVLGSSLRVNSLHHQGLDDLGEGLVPAGRSPDGLVEAVERPGKCFVVGVQWHPECLGPEHRSFELFRTFVNAAREVRA